MAAIHTHRRALLATGLDPHALALFTRAGLSVAGTYWAGTSYEISGQQLLGALSRLARRLKNTVVDGASLWSRLGFCYPFAGDTLAGHLGNLCSLNGSEDGTLFGGADYVLSGQGFQLLGGGNRYLNTGFNPAASLSLDSNHLSVYATTEGSGVQIDIGGATGDGNNYFDILAELGGYAYFENSGGGMLYAPVTTGRGLTTATRTATYVASLYRGSTLLATDTTHLNVAYPLLVGIGNRAGASNPSTRTYAWASGGWGLTASQQAALYSIVQQYQTALHRQV